MNALFLVGTLLFLGIAAGFLLGGVWGSLGGMLFAGVILGGAYQYSDRLLTALYHAKPLKNDRVIHLVDRIVHEAKIPTPSLALLPSSGMNAIVAGTARKSMIAITEDLLTLSDDELEAVLAHEIAMIKNHEVVPYTLAAVLTTGLAWLGQKAYFDLEFWKSEKTLPKAGALLLALPAAALLRWLNDPQKVFKADWTGALLTKKPHALAQALRRLSQEPRPVGFAGTNPLWIVSPLKPDWFTSWFASHPPIQQRIERLEIDPSF